MPRGALLVEFDARCGPVRHNILRFATRDPWTALLVIACDPGVGLVVMQGWRGETREWRLPVPRLSEGETIVFSLQWDVAARAGILSAWLPDRPELFVAAAAPPLPMHDLDAARMMTDRTACQSDSSLRWMALSDCPVPVGPVTGISPQAPVGVPGGTLPADRLIAGDAVRLADGGIGRIRWAGSVRLPARGRLQPYLLRAPYNGQTEDFAGSSDLRLRLRGSDIDYLFGTETVAATLRQLADQRCVVRSPPPLTVRYRQFLLDRPGAMIVGGAAVEPFDIAGLGTDPRVIAVSSPGRALIGPGGLTAPTGRPRYLHDFEAMSLRRMRAA